MSGGNRMREPTRCATQPSTAVPFNPNRSIRKSCSRRTKSHLSRRKPLPTLRCYIAFRKQRKPGQKAVTRPNLRRRRSGERSGRFSLRRRWASSLFGFLLLLQQLDDLTVFLGFFRITVFFVVI